MGNIDNPRIWTGGELFVAPVGTALPTTIVGALNAAFVSTGLLSEDGISEGRDGDSSDLYAQDADGVILARTVYSKEKRTFKVVCLEDNPAVFDLIEPGGSVATSGGVTTKTVAAVRVANPKAMVIVHKDGVITRRRTLARAEVTEVAEVEMPTDDFTAYELTITVYPTGGVLYRDVTDDPQAASSGVTLASLLITGTPPTAVASIKKLVATATFTPSGTVDVSSAATWSTSNAGVATVDPGGFVTGIGTGTATITATYGAESDDQAVTIA